MNTYFPFPSTQKLPAHAFFSRSLQPVFLFPSWTRHTHPHPPGQSRILNSLSWPNLNPESHKTGIGKELHRFSLPSCCECTNISHWTNILMLSPPLLFAKMEQGSAKFNVPLWKHFSCLAYDEKSRIWATCVLFLLFQQGFFLARQRDTGKSWKWKWKWKLFCFPKKKQERLSWKWFPSWQRWTWKTIVSCPSALQATFTIFLNEHSTCKICVIPSSAVRKNARKVKEKVLSKFPEAQLKNNLSLTKFWLERRRLSMTWGL